MLKVCQYSLCLLDFAQILALGITENVAQLLRLQEAYEVAWKAHENSRQSLLILGETMAVARKQLSSAMQDPQLVLHHLEQDLDFVPTDKNLEELASLLGWKHQFNSAKSAESSGSNLI